VTSIDISTYTQREIDKRAARGPRIFVHRSERTRRVLNLLVAGVAIILAAPIMVVVAAIIRATSRGPVLYAQTRVGIDRRWRNTGIVNHRRRGDMGGRPFTIYKFRTMEVGGHPDVQVWARPDDPRVTKTGRILRKYRLDELPQLFNVLRGDMNLVGPRPEQPKIFAHLRDRIDRYPERQRVLPGITGWAQVQHHYDATVEDVKKKLTLDLEYVERRSAVQDFKIMARTLPVIVFKKGAW
jgi:lipopolysaccharide/colanic/teichoic acid biosynthesis glycosyltransferase